MFRVRLPRAVLLGGVLGACYGGQGASPQSPEASARPSLGKRAKGAPDDCAQEPGKPPPQPLRTQYLGVAKAARCDREVYGIMGGLTHFLGVECRHCHLEPNYQADTHNKQVANWMARELVPRLTARGGVNAGEDGGGENGVWCNDCHAGKAKILGSPRRRDVAIEWMTTHLAEDFETTQGKQLKCKDCHGGDLGSPQFRSKIILGELAGLPAPAPAAPEAAPAPAPTAAPIPDFGAR